MLKVIRRNLSRDEGFTLIELMVVVMIIAVLIAIAIPSFLGFRKSAGDYTETAADITALEPNAGIAAAPADGVYIDLNAASSDVVCIVRTADSGNTFAVWESASAGTYYGATDLSGADCPAAAPGTYSQGGW